MTGDASTPGPKSEARIKGEARPLVGLVPLFLRPQIPAIIANVRALLKLAPSDEATEGEVFVIVDRSARVATVEGEALSCEPLEAVAIVFRKRRT